MSVLCTWCFQLNPEYPNRTASPGPSPPPSGRGVTETGKARWPQDRPPRREPFAMTSIPSSIRFEHNVSITCSFLHSHSCSALLFLSCSPGCHDKHGSLCPRLAQLVNPPRRGNEFRLAWLPTTMEFSTGEHSPRARGSEGGREDRRVAVGSRGTWRSYCLSTRRQHRPKRFIPGTRTAQRRRARSNTCSSWHVAARCHRHGSRGCPGRSEINHGCRL